MNSIQRKELIRNLIPIVKVIIGQFFTGGKTKLGVYILGVTILSLKFFADIEPAVATANPNVLPTVAKIATGVGSTILSIGLSHDVIKKGRGIFKDIKNLF